MSAIDQALREYLAGYAGLTAIVGQRIYAVRMPDGVTFPALALQRISTDREHAQTGPSGLGHARFQVSCWAKDLPTAKSAIMQARYALDGFTGTMGSTYAVAVFSALCQGDHDTYEPDTYLYGCRMDVRIRHREATQ